MGCLRQLSRGGKPCCGKLCAKGADNECARCDGKIARCHFSRDYVAFCSEQCRDQGPCVQGESVVAHITSVAAVGAVATAAPTCARCKMILVGDDPRWVQRDGVLYCGGVCADVAKPKKQPDENRWMVTHTDRDGHVRAIGPYDREEAVKVVEFLGPAAIRTEFIARTRSWLYLCDVESGTILGPFTALEAAKRGSFVPNVPNNLVAHVLAPLL